jgi:hypothetical protein
LLGTLKIAFTAEGRQGKDISVLHFADLHLICLFVLVATHYLLTMWIELLMNGSIYMEAKKNRLSRGGKE